MALQEHVCTYDKAQSDEELPFFSQHQSMHSQMLVHPQLASTVRTSITGDKVGGGGFNCTLADESAAVVGDRTKQPNISWTMMLFPLSVLVKNALSTIEFECA